VRHTIDSKISRRSFPRDCTKRAQQNHHRRIGGPQGRGSGESILHPAGNAVRVIFMFSTLIPTSG
jgi:hypothetical protein